MGLKTFAALAAFTAACLAAPAIAVDAPTPAALEAGLTGQWRGALGYRDYQTDKLFELPVATEIPGTCRRRHPHPHLGLRRRTQGRDGVHHNRQPPRPQSRYGNLHVVPQRQQARTRNRGEAP